MKTDRELIRSYLRGDERAFEAFYARHRRSLFVYLLSIVGDREAADELLQETFFAFLRQVERLDRCDDLRPYLFRTARSRAYDHLRHERRGNQALEKRRIEILRRQEETDPFRRSQDREEIESLLQRLPDEQREVIVLRGLLGLTFPEIARLSGIPENTAVSRYRYGMEKLRGAPVRMLGSP